MTTAAAIDRLVHHAIVIELTGKSIRVEDAQAERPAEGASPPNNLVTPTKPAHPPHPERSTDGPWRGIRDDHRRACDSAPICPCRDATPSYLTRGRRVLGDYDDQRHRGRAGDDGHREHVGWWFAAARERRRENQLYRNDGLYVPSAW